MKNYKSKRRILWLSYISIIVALGLTACSSSKQKTSNSDTASVQQKNIIKDSSTTSSQNNSNKVKNENTNPQGLATNNTNLPKIVKQIVPSGTKITFNTPWQNSDNGVYSACIEGKGNEALEEGVGKILVKDNKGEIASFEIADNKKLSPRYIEWIDNQNLLVIIGSSYGTVSKGGNLYLLNVNSGKFSLILETSDKKQQIMSAQKYGNNIDLKVNVYDDNNYNKSHIENWTIYSFDINLQKKMEVKNSEGKEIYTIN
jgi:hypothetical protein